MPYLAYGFISYRNQMTSNYFAISISAHNTAAESKPTPVTEDVRNTHTLVTLRANNVQLTQTNYSFFVRKAMLP
jgi:hypothetical protein